jgi:hypothetical protein
MRENEGVAPDPEAALKLDPASLGRIRGLARCTSEALTRAGHERVWSSNSAGSPEARRATAAHHEKIPLTRQSQTERSGAHPFSIMLALIGYRWRKAIMLAEIGFDTFRALAVALNRACSGERRRSSRGRDFDWGTARH